MELVELFDKSENLVGEHRLSLLRHDDFYPASRACSGAQI